MRIAQVSPLYERVPPIAYGGTERIVSYLTEQLHRLGHEVTLFASGDSITKARLEAGCDTALRMKGCADPLAPHIRMIGRVYDRARDFDIIHCHTDYIGLPAARLVETPTVVTLHGRLDLPELPTLYDEFREIPLIAISDAQRRALPRANWMTTVHHGLPADLFRFSPQGGDYLLFLGRICPEKRPDTAIRVACRAGVPLRIAAKVDAIDRAYFEEVVRPLLDHPLVDFMGEVGDEDKNELIGGALALLFPIDWPEPFGLVMIESLACGTPVIARRRGSVPEILRHGETAWLCETEDEMVQAVEQVRTLDRRRCREDFDKRFTVETMTARYLEAYNSLIGRARRLSLPSRTAKLAETVPILPKGENGRSRPGTSA